MGVTNRHAVRHVTYGRELELKGLRQTIQIQASGSSQVIVGEYGVGKSHLCEMLSFYLEEQGYAVARLELGASHSRAEYPRYILEAIENNLRVHIDGHLYSGLSDLVLLRRAIDSFQARLWDRRDVLSAHEHAPGRQNLSARVGQLRQTLMLHPNYNPHWMSLASEVPFELTATNRAVAQLNHLAHLLKVVGVPGVVVIFDEAERSETLPRGSYRVERARDVIVGFALASSNKDTSSLKHFRNESIRSHPYLPSGLALFHTVFAFTYPWGLSVQLERLLGITALRLSPFKKNAHDSLFEKIINLYEQAYDYAPHMTNEDVRRLKRDNDDSDVRSVVRTMVAGLDYFRYREEDGDRH